MKPSRIFTLAAMFPIPTFSSAVATAPEFAACGGACAALVSDSGRYDAWPMVQALPGGRVVCAFSRGSGHSTGEGSRGVFAKVSDDGGATWCGDVLVCDSPDWGEVTVGKGIDDSGAMLLWVRRQDRRGWGVVESADGGRTWSQRPV